jgi:hypothetical protein
MPRAPGPRKSRFDDPLKEATIGVLKNVIDPLLDLMFDASVTVHEFCQLARERAVRTARRRESIDGGRKSKSRVAIMTGLPRSEVARILKSDDLPPGRRLGQHPARKVLAAWFDNPRFLAMNGDPAVLPIFGKRRSFEQLVATHSRGTPVRAMLDELTQMDAVEILDDQRVKAKTRIPVSTGLTGSAIAVIGERTRDLLDTLRSNLRCKSTPFFEGTAVLDEADLDMVSLLRREIAEQGENFITSANSLLSRSCTRQIRSNAKPSAKCRVGVTVFYFQGGAQDPSESKIETARRKNLQRKRRPINSRRTLSASGRPASKL